MPAEAASSAGEARPRRQLMRDAGEAAQAARGDQMAARQGNAARARTFRKPLTSIRGTFADRSG
jgi:hypothetical protein